MLRKTQRMIAESISTLPGTSGGVVSASTLVPEAVAAYLDAREAAGDLAAGSLRSYRAVAARYVDSGLGALEVREVGTPMLSAWLRSLPPASARQVRALLLGCWGWLIVQGVVERSPVAGTRLPRKPARRVYALDPADLGRWLAAVDVWQSAERAGPKRAAPWLSDLTLMLLGTGGRISEVLTLRWDDVLGLDGDGPVVARLRGTKTDSADRAVTLPGFAVDALRRQQGRAVPGSDYTFSTRNGRPLTTAVVYRAMGRVRDHAAENGTEVPKFTPHDLRKTAATWLAESGRVEDAQAQLGHSDSAVTARYYVADPEVVDYAAVLDAAWSQG